MSESNHYSDRLREPLNETTRKVRRNLLASSVVGLVITKVGLIPEKISAFGIEFTSANQEALKMLLFGVILYFLIMFAIYVYSELTAWRIVFTSSELENQRIASEKMVQFNHPLGRDPKQDEFTKKIRNIFFLTKHIFYLRLSVELAIPVLFSIYSCYLLLTFQIT